MVGPSLAPTPTPQIVSEHKFHKFRSWRDAGNENVTKDEVEIEHLSVTSSTIIARDTRCSNHIYCCTEEGDMAFDIKSTARSLFGWPEQPF